MKRISYPIGERNLDGSYLIVREELSERINHGKVYLCECTCGDENCKGGVKVRMSDLKKVKSCKRGRPRKKVRNAEYNDCEVN